MYVNNEHDLQVCKLEIQIMVSKTIRLLSAECGKLLFYTTKGQRLCLDSLVVHHFDGEDYKIFIIPEILIY